MIAYNIYNRSKYYSHANEHVSVRMQNDEKCLKSEFTAQYRVNNRVSIIKGIENE